MNEVSFKEKWESEISIYKAWGDYVVTNITRALERKKKNTAEFLKIAAIPRLKDTNSLIDKAVSVSFFL